MAKRALGLQRGNAEIWMPNTEEDLELTRTFKANQIIVCKITGGWNKKQRSFQQLSLLMAAIIVVILEGAGINIFIRMGILSAIIYLLIRGE